MSQKSNSSVHSDYFEIYEGSMLGKSHRVEALLGEGCFGVVAKCRNIETNDVVAIKVNKNDPEVIDQATKEAAILSRLRFLDPDTCNIVRYNGCFVDQDCFCLSFELLDQSLHSYLEERNCGLPMTEIRSVLQQLATAFFYLKTTGIIHADLNLENIMIVDHQQQPLKVRLIDFGLARPAFDSENGVCTQAIWNRAPEVTLLIPYNEAIDMWSLGTAAVHMATGYPLYPGDTEYDVLRFITETQGQPADDVLDRGSETDYFFHPQSNGQQRWRLKTPEEFHNEIGHYSRDTRYMRLRSLDDLEKLMFRCDQRDKQLLVDLIKGLLHLDQDQRLQPQEVLQHPFVTGSLPQSSPAHICVDLTNTAERKENPDVKDIQPVKNAGLLKCFYRGIASAFNFGCNYLHGVVSNIFGLISRCKVGEPRGGGHPV